VSRDRLIVIWSDPDLYSSFCYVYDGNPLQADMNAVLTNPELVTMQPEEITRFVESKLVSRRMDEQREQAVKP
jgi:hypothetical protein